MKGTVRTAVTENDPSRVRSPLPSPGPGDVDRFVGRKAGPIAAAQDGHRADRGVVAEDPVVPAGRILAVAQGEEESGTDENPQWVEQPEPPPHAGYDTAP